MTSRERFCRTLRFQDVDRPPLMEFWWYEQETIERWFAEGLPIPRPHPRSELVGELFTMGFVHREDLAHVADAFGLERQVSLSLDALPLPRFDCRTIREDAGSRTYVDAMGCTVKASKTDPRNYCYLDSPVQTLDDLEEMKKRYDPKEHSDSRAAAAWTTGFLESLTRSDRPVGLYSMGLFRQAQYLLGAENLLVAVHENPRLLHGFFGFWADYIIEHSRRVVENSQIDYALLTEDMAYNKGSQLSPAHYREFMMPHHRRISDHFRNHGVDILMIDCAGDTSELIPLYLEAGFNCQSVLQASAGVDAASLRRTYGRKIALIGNISLEHLIDGGEALDEEIRAKVPALVAQGGYIPGIDDIVSPDVPLGHYRRCVELVRRTVGKSSV